MNGNTVTPVESEDAVAQSNQERAAKQRTQLAFLQVKHAYFLMQITRLPDDEFEELCGLARKLMSDEYVSQLKGVTEPALVVEARREHQLQRSELLVVLHRLGKYRLSKRGRSSRGA